MTKLTVSFVALIVCIVACDAKVFDRCGLVQELRRQGFPANQLRDWVCLIEAESSRNTAAVNKSNSNGSWDWGLFQINDRFWCNRGNTAGKDCNAKCNDFILDNITRASNCAKIVYRRHGFSAWYGWKNKCNGKPLPNISSC